MSTVTGVIEAKTKGKTKRGTYGIKIGDTWYNSKFEIEANRGDEVSFETDSERMINGLKVLGKASTGSAGGGSKSRESDEQYERRQRLIVRQSCLSSAAGLFAGIDAFVVEQVTAVAAEFEKWVYREDDAKKEEAPPFAQ